MYKSAKQINGRLKSNTIYKRQRRAQKIILKHN